MCDKVVRFGRSGECPVLETCEQEKGASAHAL